MKKHKSEGKLLPGVKKETIPEGMTIEEVNATFDKINTVLTREGTNRLVNYVLDLWRTDGKGNYKKDVVVLMRDMKTGNVTEKIGHKQIETRHLPK